MATSTTIEWTEEPWNPVSRRSAAILNDGATYDMTRRLDREPIKVRILSLVKERPLRNEDIRKFTDLGRQQVYRILKELEAEELVYQQGHGQSALWHTKQLINNDSKTFLCIIVCFIVSVLTQIN